MIMRVAQMLLFGSAVGVLGGAAAPLFGSILMAAGWFFPEGGARHWLFLSGSFLLFLTIPLIILGASCLDWVEKTELQDRHKISPDEDDDQ
jgi:hypothetical protein